MYACNISFEFLQSVSSNSMFIFWEPFEICNIYYRKLHEDNIAVSKQLIYMSNPMGTNILHVCQQLIYMP